MSKFKVVEKFVSINGESRRAGQLAVFVRFAGCNLCCEYCDTKWANEKAVEYEEMSALDIYNYIKSTKVSNVTLTGGEPLLQENIKELFEILARDDSLYVEIETNGSVDVGDFRVTESKPSFTIDYKTSVSGMEQKMNMKNFENAKETDTIKFVCGSIKDLETARDVIDKYDLAEKCAVYLSPVFGKIEAKDMVDFMIENNMNHINLQLQLHKYIWDPNKKGV